MKNKIKRFAKGDFHIPQPEIIFPETHIIMRVGEGEKYQGSFSLQNEGEGTIRGLVYPSSYRIQCVEQGFDGNPVIFIIHMTEGDLFRDMSSMVSSRSSAMVVSTILHLLQLLKNHLS